MSSLPPPASAPFTPQEPSVPWAPGPWVCREYGSPRGTYFVRTASGQRLFNSIACGEANARLIAAAPELYAALKNALLDLEYSLAYAQPGSMRAGDLETTIEMTCAALAKAAAGNSTGAQSQSDGANT